MVPDTTFLTAELATVRAELVRVDAKASTLLTLAGTALTIGLAVLARADLPTPALTAGAATVAVIGVAVGLLACAVRPSLGGSHGLVRYAVSAPGDLMTDAALPPLSMASLRAHELVWLSHTAVRKYRRVRAAVDLLLAGLVGIAVTALLTALA
ncbi:Pycsar system effector family protein [Micromonospora schwarzwaldensis]|uniref:Pycsar system effector family protein n=1 Tax=Micromonospora sp. DSM 45708 TaxID=3111767 RepID=UPI0031D4AD3F